MNKNKKWARWGYSSRSYLNPIENAWTELKDRIYTLYPDLESFDGTKEQLKNMNDYLDELQEAADKICKGCKYCLSCPQEVNIPYIFELYIDHQIYGLKDYASQMYSNLETNSEFTGKNALSCFNCGLCSQKCPLNIEISIKLKEAHKTLSPYYQEIEKTELKTKRKRK